MEFALYNCKQLSKRQPNSVFSTHFPQMKNTATLEKK